MIWPIFLAAALILAAVTPSKKRAQRAGLLIIAVGIYCASSLGGLMGDPWRTFAAASLWVGIGATIGFNGGKDATFAGILLVLAGLAVIPVRVTGADYEVGQAFLVASDCLGCAAILILGRSATFRVAHGIRGVWLYCRGRILGDSVYRDTQASKRK